MVKSFLVSQVSAVMNAIASLFKSDSHNSYPFFFPVGLSAGLPIRRKSRFSGVARVKRIARKLRNRRRSRAH